MLDGHKDFGQVKDGDFFGQAHALTDLLQEFAARDVLKEQVQAGLVLEGFEKVDEEAPVRITSTLLTAIELVSDV